MSDRLINGKQHSLAIPATQVDQGPLEMLISWVVTQLGYNQQWCMLPKNSTSPRNHGEYMPCFTGLNLGGLVSVTYLRWTDIYSHFPRKYHSTTILPSDSDVGFSQEIIVVAKLDICRSCHQQGVTAIDWYVRVKETHKSESVSILSQKANSKQPNISKATV